MPADEKALHGSDLSSDIAERAGLIVSDLSEEWGDLALDYHPVLRPLVGHPFLSRLLGELHRIGVRHVKLFTNRMSHQVVEFVGDGERWGMKISVHPVRNDEKARQMFAKWRKGKRAILAYADCLPHVASSVLEGPLSSWELHDEETSSPVQLASSAALLSCLTPDDFRYSAKAVLNNQRPDIIVPAANPEDSVWLGRNVSIHPTAEIIPPVFIGRDVTIEKNTVVGPNATIESNCIVSEHVTATEAVVLSDTFVGEELDLSHKMAAPHCLALEGRSSVCIADASMLGSVHGSHHLSFLRASGILLAGILSILSLPFLLILVVAALLIDGRHALRQLTIIATPAPANPLLWRRSSILTFTSTGNPTWDRIVSVPLIRKLPMLAGVAMGKLAWVGLPPRTHKAMMHLSEQDRLVALSAPPGFFTLAEIDHARTDNAFEIQEQGSNAFYISSCSGWRDLRLAVLGFCYSMIPAKHSPPDSDYLRETPQEV